MSRTKVFAAVMVAVLTAALGAVMPAGAGASVGPNVRVAKFTGAPISIGVTYVCNGPTPPFVCEIAPAAQAEAKSFNAAGGLKTADGKTHELKVILCNNENDRTKIAGCAKQFVDAKVAYVSGAVEFGDELVPVLQAAGIPYFSPTCASNCTAEGTAPNTYILGFTLGLFQGLVKQLTDAGFKKISVVAQGAGVAIGGLTKPIAKAGGASLTIVEAPLQNPNWAQIATQASQNADVIFTVSAEAETKAFIDAFAQTGSKIPVTSVIGIITNDLITSTGGAKSPTVGGISTGYFPPPQDKAWADYRTGMKKYANGTQLEPAGQQVWMAIQLASEIMKGMKGDVNAATFTAAVNATTNIPTLGGKLPPGKSFQKPEGLYPRIFNNDYWGPLKITRNAIANGKGATFAPAPSG